MKADFEDYLIDAKLITGTDRVLDYGFGKGRVSIYLNHKLGCKIIGVEHVDGFFDGAVLLLSTG